MKLFAIYVGGEAKGANIEVHDMRFVAASSIEDTHAELKRQWWGIPKSLHIDCWAQIDHADGYDVSLRPTPFSGEEHLYYVNLGGYDPGKFMEMHMNVFVVAKTIPEAKARAIKSAKGWNAPHRDEMYEAEQAFSLVEAAGRERVYIHLTPAPSRPLSFVCNYKRLH